MMPVMAYSILESITLLPRGVALFTGRCIRGLRADETRCALPLERSPLMATALVPGIGCDAAASLARTAHEGGRSIREVALEKGILPEGDIERLLDPRRMTGR